MRAEAVGPRGAQELAAFVPTGGIAAEAAPKARRKRGGPSTPRGQVPGTRLHAHRRRGEVSRVRGPRPLPRSPAERLAACRAQLALLQDRLAEEIPWPQKEAELHRNIAELAAQVGWLSALRGRLVQVLLG